MLHLALGMSGHANAKLFLVVAPDAREPDVREQLMRPAFTRVADLRVRFLPYSWISTVRQGLVLAPASKSLKRWPGT
jgi:type II restriction enzyme